MAYARPTYRRRAPAAKYQTKSVYKKTVRRPAAAIATLDAKVRKVVRSMAGLKSTVQYQATASNPIGNVGGTNVYILPISQYSTWNRIFGTDADDESNHSAVWKKFNFDFQINSYDRSDLDYTFYLVSLTKIGQSELFTPSTGGLAGPLGITTLGTNHVVKGGTTGMAFLNKKYFNIHQCKRIITGSVGGSLATETVSLRKRWYLKMAHNKGAGHRLQNPKGDWKALPSPQAANQNMYVLIANNDSTVDQSAYFQMNAIHTVDIA